jgi:dihydroorotate dehydrogenase (fumarate)
VHEARDVIKLVMAGASVTMMCSGLLKHGIGHIWQVLCGLEGWMQEHEYDSVNAMRGTMSQRTCPDPAAFERANYMKALNTYTTEGGTP